MNLTGIFIGYELGKFLFAHMSDWHTAFPLIIAILSTVTTGVASGALLGVVYLKQRKRLRGDFETLAFNEEAYLYDQRTQEFVELSTHPQAIKVIKELKVIEKKGVSTDEEVAVLEAVWGLLNVLSQQEKMNEEIDWEKECAKMFLVCEILRENQREKHLQDFTKINHLLDLRYNS